MKCLLQSIENLFSLDLYSSVYCRFINYLLSTMRYAVLIALLSY